MKIIAFDGSPRKHSNSSMIMKEFLDEIKDRADIKYYKTDKLEIQSCRGCLMCNSRKQCVLKDQHWETLCDEILEANVLAFSMPIYFHHASSSMKKLLDRFRSFLKVQITEDGIIHTPHIKWEKKIFLFTAHGSSSPDDAKPLIEMFEFMTDALGAGNELKTINGLRLAVSGQIGFNKERLIKTYELLGLPAYLAEEDLNRNAEWLDTARRYAAEI